MRLSDLIVWLAIIIFFTDASQTIIEIIHGPQPKTEAPAKAPTEPSKGSGDLKPNW